MNKLPIVQQHGGLLKHEARLDPLAKALGASVGVLDTPIPLLLELVDQGILISRGLIDRWPATFTVEELRRVVAMPLRTCVTPASLGGGRGQQNFAAYAVAPVTRPCERLRSIGEDPTAVPELRGLALGWLRARPDGAWFDSPIHRSLAKLDRVGGLFLRGAFDAAESGLARLAAEQQENHRWHLLAADLAFARGNHEAAAKAYAEAVAIQPDFFLGWLGHGESLRRMNRFEEAEVALVRSGELYPTGQALLSLARIRLARGEKNQAQPLLAEAAAGQGAAAAEAQATLITLGLGSEWLQLQRTVDGRGQALLEIRNRSAAWILELALEVRWPGDGTLESFRWSLSKPLAPGGLRLVALPDAAIRHFDSIEVAAKSIRAERRPAGV